MPTNSARTEANESVFDLDVREIATEPNKGDDLISLICSTICSTICSNGCVS